MSADLDPTQPWIDALRFDADGLIPAISRDATTGAVLMMAWMNREALERTVAEGVAIYWSRSRSRLWRKGEESGHQQRVRALRTDCDGDVLLLDVDQAGGIACHTGRASCFYYELHDGAWTAAAPVLKSPEEMYRK